MASLFGDIQLTNAKGEKISAAEALKDKKAIGIYFSAHWCPPCRGFTPMLASSYTDAANSAFEIVFVSSDRDEASFRGYLATMPWLAVPLGDAKAQELKSRFRISGIPTLIVVDANGNVITAQGRNDIISQQEGAIRQWTK